MKISILVWFCLVLVAIPSRADVWRDSKPPLSWQEMMDCELVVVAHYESHENLNAPKDDQTPEARKPNAKMVLRVDRVLRGAVKPGATIEVFLEHFYSLQTGATGWNFRFESKQDDGIPKLGYQQQITNPGDLVPISIFPDARQPILYFLPQAERPALTQRAQVQPLLWENEWRNALSNKPTDVVFRLAQNVSTPIRRDALEELYARRNAASIDRLFQLANRKSNPWMLGDWRWWDFDAFEVLCVIGDRNGDVYNRARADNLFAIMARVNPPRAWRDITRFLDQALAGGRASDVATQNALYSLHYFQADEMLARAALSRALKELTQPRLAQASAEVVGALLSPNSDWYYRRMWLPATPRLSSAQRNQFLIWAKPRVLACLARPDILPEPKRQLADVARNLWRLMSSVSTQVDLAGAEKILLDPTQEFYANNNEGEAYNLLQRIKESSDPKFIPLLVGVLREVPAARSALSYSLGKTMLHYGSVFPERMRREFIAQGLENFFADEDMKSSSYANLPESLGLSSTIYQIRDAFENPQYRVLLQKYPPSQKLMEKFENMVAQTIDGSHGPYPWDLKILFFLKSDKATLFLNQALANREKYPRLQQRALLLVAMETNGRGVTPKLIEIARADSNGWPREEGIAALLELLRLSNDARDYKRYLEWLNYFPAASRASYATWRPLDEVEPNSAHIQLLIGLATKHRAEYSRRIAKLLRSPSLPERQTGEQALKAVYPDANFSAADFADKRAQMLLKLRPLLVF